MIRDAKDNDVNGLAILMNELGYPTTTNQMKQRLSNIIINPFYRTFVYERDKQIVGMIGMILGFRYEKDESYIRIVAFVVNSKYRGQGIGTLLLSEAEKWARSNGAKMITLNSGDRSERFNAHNFYLSNGFEGKAIGFYKVLE